MTAFGTLTAERCCKIAEEMCCMFSAQHSSSSIDQGVTRSQGLDRLDKTDRKHLTEDGCLDSTHPPIHILDVLDAPAWLLTTMADKAHDGEVVEGSKQMTEDTKPTTSLRDPVKKWSLEFRDMISGDPTFYPMIMMRCDDVPWREPLPILPSERTYGYLHGKSLYSRKAARGRTMQVYPAFENDSQRLVILKEYWIEDGSDDHESPQAAVRSVETDILTRLERASRNDSEKVV